MQWKCSAMVTFESQKTDGKENVCVCSVTFNGAVRDGIFRCVLWRDILIIIIYSVWVCVCSSISWFSLTHSINKNHIFHISTWFSLSWGENCIQYCRFHFVHSLFILFHFFVRHICGCSFPFDVGNFSHRNNRSISVSVTNKWFTY